MEFGWTAPAAQIQGGIAGPPVVVDGTGLVTTVPLTIKTGRNLSGVDLWAGPSAAAGYLLRDSGGTLRGNLGLVVSTNDWVGAALANDVTLRAETGGVIIQAASVTRGVQIWSAGNTGTNEAFLSVTTNFGVKLGYSTSNWVQVAGGSVSLVAPVVTYSASTKFQGNGRFMIVAGTATAAASTFTMPFSDSCSVTGTGTINWITTTNWDVGSRVYLNFTAAAVVIHAASNPPIGTAAILLSGGQTITFAANTMLQLYYNGTNWVDCHKIA